MAKRGAPLDDSGALFCVFSRKNKEKSLRELFVGLQSGNCFDGILIEQLK